MSSGATLSTAEGRALLARGASVGRLPLSLARPALVAGKPPRKRRRKGDPPAPGSVYEEAFALFLLAHGFVGWVREYRFARPPGTPKGPNTRDWRLDFAEFELRIYVEIHGGTHSNGRHNRGAGMAEDLRKHNAAALDGWLGLYVPGTDCTGPEFLATLRAAVNLRRRQVGG
jgi:hypothetical protein